MERLTKRGGYVRADQFNEAFARLAAYEDTGLEPEEISAVVGLASTNCARAADGIDKLLAEDAELASYRALGPIDHLRELLEAERDGRCVVLPCALGTQVRVNGGSYLVEGFLCNKIGTWKVHLTPAVPRWIGNQRNHWYMSFRAFEKQTRAEAEAAQKEGGEDKTEYDSP